MEPFFAVLPSSGKRVKIRSRVRTWVPNDGSKQKGMMSAKRWVFILARRSKHKSKEPQFSAMSYMDFWEDPIFFLMCENHFKSFILQLCERSELHLLSSFTQVLFIFTSKRRNFENCLQNKNSPHKIIFQHYASHSVEQITMFY